MPEKILIDSHRKNRESHKNILDLMKKNEDLSQLIAIGSSLVLTHYLGKLEHKFICSRF